LSRDSKAQMDSADIQANLRVLNTDITNDRLKRLVNDTLKNDELQKLKKYILEGWLNHKKCKKKSLSRYVYWPNIDYQIENVMEGCQICQENLNLNSREPFMTILHQVQVTKNLMVKQFKK